MAERRQVSDDSVPHKQAEGGAGTVDNSDKIRVWYDSEGDFLEVSFSDARGTFEETDLDQVMAKIDQAGRVIGFSILKVSTLRGHPLEVSLSR